MLERLPYDISHQITGYFEPDDVLHRCDLAHPLALVALKNQYTDLLNFSLVSKAWNELFQPLNSRVFWDNGSHARIQNLVSRGLKEPELLRNIHSVSLSYRQSHGELDYKLQGAKFLTEADRTCKSNPAINTWNDRFFAVQHANGYSDFRNPDPMIWQGLEQSLLLAMLPNLHTVQIRLGSLGMDGFRWIMELFRWSSQRPILLPKLRNITVLTDSEWDQHLSSHSAREMRQILQLKQVHRLAIGGAWNAHESMAPNTSGVQHLVLKPWNGYIEPLFRAIKCLKSFEFDMYGGPDFQHVQNVLRTIKRGLTKYKGSLESLSIQGSTSDANWDPTQEFAPLGSFKDFTALKHLDLGDILVIGKPWIALPDLNDSQAHMNVQFFQLIRDHVIEQLALRDLDLPVPGLDDAFGQASDWEVLTDIFPKQLETLKLHCSPQPRDATAGNHYKHGMWTWLSDGPIGPQWVEQFEMCCEQRLPALEGLEY